MLTPRFILWYLSLELSIVTSHSRLSQRVRAHLMGSETLIISNILCYDTHRATEDGGGSYPGWMCGGIVSRLFRR